MAKEAHASVAITWYGKALYKKRRTTIVGRVSVYHAPNTHAFSTIPVMCRTFLPSTSHNECNEIVLKARTFLACPYPQKPNNQKLALKSGKARHEQGGREADFSSRQGLKPSIGTLKNEGESQRHSDHVPYKRTLQDNQRLVTL